MSFDDRINALGADHLAIFELLVAKAEFGARKYSVLDLGADDRNFEAEARAELLDCVHYLGAEVVRLKRERDGLRVLCAEQRATIDRQRLEIGLREVATAPAVEMRGVVAIDFSEVEG